ncbi:hypothetical protein ScPMuIL_009518 [Solemya velum]
MASLDCGPPKKRPKESQLEENEETFDKQDRDYFRSYSDIAVHEEMLSDTIRTNAYRHAILKNYENVHGKIVADIGAGTGILSIFCVQAGAKKVYAIEASDMVEQTRRIVDENRMSDRIDVVQNKVEDVVFPEELDVIVSEWMGYNLFYESMLQSLIHTREKWLKKGGLMMPSAASLYLAPFTDEDYPDRLELWSDMYSLYKVSMEAMKPYAQKCIASRVIIRSISPESVQAHAHKVCCLDMKEVQRADIEKVQNKFEFRCFGHSEIHGFTTWFTVDFPGGTSLTTSPYSEGTHWAQTLLYIDQPLDVEQDTLIRGTISISANPKMTRYLDISLSYRVGEGPVYHKYYLMNDWIT